MKLVEFHDLNYCSTIEQEHPGKIGDLVKKATSINLIKAILRLIFNALRQIIYGVKTNSCPTGIETVIIINTFNQLRAMDSIIKSLPNSLVISTFPVKCNNNLVTDFNGNCLYSLLYMPRLVISLLKATGFRKKAMTYHFSDFLNTPGVYKQAKKYLDSINPKSILVANDHTFFPRSYFRLAQKKGIKTIYTQHASVSVYFPQLEFDYAFLDGQETFDKYTANGRAYTSKIFFSGSPRFDKIPLLRKNNIFDLGIAINILDEKQSILNFLETISNSDITFAVRPHPALENKLFWEEYCKLNLIGYSDPLSELPTTFISNCRCFAAGDSAFHLEVALCGKNSYFVNFQNGNSNDWYQFIEKGLVRVKTTDEIVDSLSNSLVDKISQEKIKYYVANYETRYWGKSVELLKNTIYEINNDINFTQWKSRTGEAKIFDIKG